jgi:hypothetical protein
MKSPREIARDRMGLALCIAAMIIAVWMFAGCHAQGDYLKFNLLVDSNPRGATISYRRLYDERWRPWSQPTPAMFQNFSLGTYEIRVQKDGCKDKMVTFDSMADGNPSIKFELECK